MRLFFPLFVAGAMLALSLAPSAGAADLVDNPAYKSWAAHKPGTTVAFQQQMSASGMNMTHEITETLKEVTPDKATLEYKIVMDFGGQKQEQTQMHEIPAKVEKGQEELPPNVKGTTKDVGSEKVEVAGKSYDCKVMEFTGQGAQGKGTGKMWRSDDIPGCLVKLEMKVDGKVQATINMTATRVELK